MKFWNKDMIIFEIFNKTGISIELTPDELRRKESRDKIEFLKHPTSQGKNGSTSMGKMTLIILRITMVNT